MEWVEKASFDRLNKLFVITSNERNHQTLLSARNLLEVIREPQPYVLPIIPRRLPKVVEPEEHFVLKDLPFYKEACEVDVKARQERLNQREEKRQEGKLRRVPGKKGQPSSSAAHPSAKKKKSFAEVIEKSTLVPTPSSAPTPHVPVSANSSHSDLKGALDLSKFEPSKLGPRH